MYIGEGNGNPLQYSCLENPVDRGAGVGATVHGVAESRTRPSNSHTHICVCITDSICGSVETYTTL